MEEKKTRNAAKDLVFGVLLVIFSVYIIISSFQMKYFKTFFDGAGFFPLIIGCVLLALGAVLTFIGIKSGGFAELKGVFTAAFLKNFFTNNRTVRVLILLAMMAVYVYILLGTIPFIWATTLYLFVTFVYLKAFQKVWVLPGWLVAAAVSVATSVVVFYAFKLGLGLMLP